MSEERVRQLTVELRTKFTELLDGLQPRTTLDDGTVYRVLSTGGSGLFAAKSPQGASSIIFPLGTVPASEVVRVTNALVLRPCQSARFAVDGREWQQPAVVLECVSAELFEAFVVLGADLAVSDGPPRWESIRDKFDSWLALFAEPKRPTVEDELGLFGELLVLASSRRKQELLNGWVAGDGEPVDFRVAGASLEVKTSRTRLTHHFSMNQALRPQGDRDSYVVSLWVAVDLATGTSVEGLVLQLRAVLPVVLFQRLLLARGLVGSGWNSSRFVLLERPHWFVADSIPGIRNVDPGVRRVRYVADLDERQALLDDRALTAAQLFGLGMELRATA